MVSWTALRPYYYWNISTDRYSGKEIKNGLVETLKKAGLKKGLFSKTKFKSNYIEVKMDYEDGAKVRINLGLYANNNEAAEKTRKLIQDRIDKEKEYISMIDQGKYKASRGITEDI